MNLRHTPNRGRPAFSSLGETNQTAGDGELRPELGEATWNS